MEPSSPLTNNLFDHLKPEHFLDQLQESNKQNFNQLFKCSHNKNSYSLKVFIEDHPFTKTQILDHIKILETIRFIEPKPSSMPKYHGYFIENKKIYLVFELFKQAVNEYLADNKKNLDNPNARAFNDGTEDFYNTIFTGYFYSLIEGLVFLQTMNVSHLHINPENVLLNKDDDLKIIDFGLIKGLSDLMRLQNEKYEPKINYMAPEVLELVTAGKILCIANPYKADLFSASLILLETLSTGPRKEGTSEKDLQKEIINRIDEINDIYGDLTIFPYYNYSYRNLMLESLPKCLEIKVNERSDFLEIFKKYAEIIKKPMTNKLLKKPKIFLDLKKKQLKNIEVFFLKPLKFLLI